MAEEGRRRDALATMIIATSPGPSDDLEARLASLRTAIGVARALGASLALPQWLNSNSALVNIPAINKIVPLVSEANTLALAAEENLCVVAVKRVGHAVELPHGDDSCVCLTDKVPAEADAIAACLRSCKVVPASSLTLTAARPLRSKAEVRAAFGKRDGVLLLPHLPSALLSASASVMSAADRASLDCALATPAIQLQRMAHALVEATMADDENQRRRWEGASASTMTEAREDDNETTATEEPPPTSPATPATPPIRMVVVVDVSGEPPDLDGVPLAERAADAARALLSAHSDEPAANDAGHGAHAVVIVDAALLAGRWAHDEVRGHFTRVGVSIAARLSRAGVHARALLPAVTDGIDHLTSSKGGTHLQLSIACRWLCASAPLLVLPPIEDAPRGLVTARQALGRPVDHTYMPRGCLPVEVARRLYAALPKAPPMTTNPPAAEPAQANKLPVVSMPKPEDELAPVPVEVTSLRDEKPPIEPACAAAGLGLRLGGEPKLGGPYRGSLAEALGGEMGGGVAAGMAGGPGEAQDAVGLGGPSAPRRESIRYRPNGESIILSLMGDKLDPTLRDRILTFHPGAAALAAASTRLGARPEALELYEAFLERTLPALRRLVFTPPRIKRARRVAVIVEPRASEAIVARTAYVIRNVGVLLNASCAGAGDAGGDDDGGWAIQFFHGTTNVDKVGAHFESDEWARVHRVSLGVDNLPSSQEYSRLLTSFWFWEQVGAEEVLIFQEDALLCGPSLSPFARDADYAGAPWDPEDQWVRGKAWLAAVGGNGGLSLRRRSHALACLDVGACQKGQWEDAYFVERLQQLGHRVASAAHARAFAIERPLHSEHHSSGEAEDAVAAAPRAPPCGLHKAYNYLGVDELRPILGAIERRYAAMADAEGT